MILDPNVFKPTVRSNGAPHSQRWCLCRCDVCGTEFEFRHADSRRRLKEFHFCTKACMKRALQKGGLLHERAVRTNLERYGNANPMHVPEVRERLARTNMERLGAANAFAAPNVKARIRAINLERHGHENPGQAANVKAKIRETFIERYGVDHPLKNPGVRARQAATNIKRYGVKSPLMLPAVHAAGMIASHMPEARRKAHETMKREGTIGRVISMAEERFGHVLMELFGPDDVETQVHINNVWSVDFKVKSLDTYVQFDGVYWHGLDKPIEELAASTDRRDRVIHRAWVRDRIQDAWFKEQGLRLVRVTDVEFARDPHACLRRVIEDVDDAPATNDS